MHDLSRSTAIRPAKKAPRRSSTPKVRVKVEVTPMHDRVERQPLSQTHPIRLSEHAPFNDSRMNLLPQEAAFNDLTFLTSRLHSKLAIKLESMIASTFETCSWALGVQPQAPVRPSSSAIVVMNAGEGIGRSLTLKFAETGYTVFALVHPGYEPAAEGSISKLMYIWQHIRAVLLSRRNEIIRHSTRHEPYLPPPTFPPLGDIIPIPFTPTSPKSRNGLKQVVEGYCRQRSLYLRVVLMTPTYTSRFGHGPYLDADLESDFIKKNGKFTGRNTDAEEQFSPTGDEKGTPVGQMTGDELPPFPAFKTETYDTPDYLAQFREGSYMAVTSVNQQVLDRTIQRDVTEQLLAVQALAELLITTEDRVKSNYSSRRNTGVPTSFTPELWHSSHETDPYCRPPLDDEMSDSEWQFGEDLEIETERGWVSSLYHFLKDKVKERYLSAPLPNFAGRVIWLSGAGEASFGSVQGLATTVDAAREAAARSLSNELSPLGIQVSVVRTGPLESRSCTIANQKWHAPQLDSRSNMDEKADPKMLKRIETQTKRAKILARISSLWALKDENCFWIIKQAAEAQYPRDHYSLGIDVLAERITAMAPETVKQLANWFVYERLAGRTIDEWLLKDRGIYHSRWIQNPLVDLGMRVISKVAAAVRTNEEVRNEALEYEGQRFAF